MIKKIIAITVLSITIISASAQELINKVSDNALYIMTINGGNVLAKVPEKEIDESLLLNQMMKSLFGRNGESKSLKDLGVDLKKEMVFAVEYDKAAEIIYGEFFYPIEDKEKFGKYIQELWGNGDIIKTGKYSTFKPKYGADRIVWNKDFAVYFQCNYIGNKFQYNYEDYYITSRKVDDVMTEYTETGDFYVALQNVEKKYKNIAKEEQQKSIQESETEATVEVQVEDAVEAVAEAVDEPAYNNWPDDYYDRRREARQYFQQQEDDKSEKLREARRNYINQQSDMRLTTFFDKKTKDFNSIVNNASYKKSIDANADATMWFKNDISKFFILGSSSYRYGNDKEVFEKFLENDINGETVAKLYFEKDKARIKIDGEYGENVKQTMSKVFNQSIDTRFFNYMKKDLIGYFSFSGSTKNFFSEIPGMYGEMYKKLYPNNETEIGLAADMFSLIIDEEAIGDLVVGDAIFVLNGVYQKDVTYKTYEYDENYNLKEIEKTKKELIPDFLFMLDSKNEKIINKLFKLGVTKKGLVSEGTYFATKTYRDLPIPLYMAFKDGIFFVSTQEAEIKEVIAGGKGNLDKKHKELLQANTSVVYYNNKKLFEQLPKEEVKNQKQLQAYNYILENSEDSFWTVNAKQGNLDSEIIINTPNNKENSAKYFFDLLNKMIEIDRN